MSFGKTLLFHFWGESRFASEVRERFLRDELVDTIEVTSLRREISSFIRNRRRQWGTVHKSLFAVSDTSMVQPLVLIALLLLVTPAAERMIIDTEGNIRRISWMRLFGKDIPHLFLELLTSIVAWPVALIMGCAARMLLHRRPMPPSGDMCFYLRMNYKKGIKAGGSVTHTAGVIKGFRRCGISCVFVAVEDNPMIEPEEAVRRLVNPFRWFANLRIPALILFNLRVFMHMIHLEREFGRPAFLYQRYSIYAIAGVLYARLRRIPLVLEYNGSEVWIAEKWGEGRSGSSVALWYENIVIQGADYIVVVSRSLRDELLNRGAKKERVLVNPNGVDPEPFIKVQREEVENLRKKLGLQNRYVVGFVGTFGPWHGAEVLAKAVKPLSKRIPDVSFLFIGDGVRRRFAEEIASHEGVVHLTIFTGMIPPEDVPVYLLACDVLVSPHVPNPDGSEFFGSPTKLFEYMMAGRPIVASALGQISEILREGETALLVEPGNVQALCDGIEKLIKNDEMRMRLGRSAREEALAHYTWQAHVRRIIEFMGLSSRSFSG